MEAPEKKLSNKTGTILEVFTIVEIDSLLNFSAI
jgi:hypothetical protein